MAAHPVSSAPKPEKAEADVQLRDLLAAVLRHRWLVVGVAAAVIAAGVLITWLQTPVYEGETTIRFSENEHPSLSNLMPLARLGVLPGVAGGSTIHTDMMVLQSRTIAESAVDSLSLHVQLLEPVGERSSILRVVEAPRNAAEAIFLLRRETDGSYAVSLEEGDEPVTIPPRVVIGQPARLGDVVVVVENRSSASPPRRLRIAVRSFTRTVEQVQSDLLITRPHSGAQIVSVSYRTADAQLAAEVPNVITESFLRYKLSTSKADTRIKIGFLRDQVESYERELADAEARLRAFREMGQVVSISDQASEQVRRFAQMQARRDEIRAERESLGRLLAQVRSQAPQRGATDPSPYRQLAAYPTFLANGAVQSILNSLINLENQRAELLVRRTAENQDVRGIDQRVSELELQLFQTASSYLKSLDNQLTSLDTALNRFTGELEGIPAQEVEFRRLLRQQTLLEEVYTLLQTQLKEAEIQEASNLDDVRVLDPAIPSEEPVAPRPLRNLVFATVLGIGLGLSSAVARSAWDGSVRTSQDVLSATAGLPVLGTIPHSDLTVHVNGRHNGSASRRVLRLPVRMLSRGRQAGDSSVEISEAFRTLRTNLTLPASSPAPRTLLVTSALPGEGKTSSVFNLAVAYSQQGVRTLLVDADLRKGTLHTFFDVPQAPGLSELLEQEIVSPDKVIRELTVDAGRASLHLLSSGTPPPNPAELLGSERMRELIAELRSTYALILFDTPPVNLFTDAVVLGSLVDGALLVARAGMTHKDALGEAVVRFGRLPERLAGVVLTDAEGGDIGAYQRERYTATERPILQ